MDYTADQLVEFFTANEPESIRRSYLALPTQGIRVAGSAAYRIGTPEYLRLPGSGLSVPVGTDIMAPIDYIGVYVTLNQYFSYDWDGVSHTPREVISALALNHTRDTLLGNLGLLNALASDDEKLEGFQKKFLETLRPELRTKLSNVLASETSGMGYRLLARQPILAAIRYLLTNDCAAAEDNENVPGLFGAALFEQAVAVDLAAERDGEDEIAGVPAFLFFEITRVEMMYESDDMWSSIDRVVRLWRHFGEQVRTFPTRIPLADLLQEVTGLEIEELLGLAFVLFAHSTQWEPGKPPFLDSNFGSAMPEEKLERFRGLVATDADALQEAFRSGTSSRFDYLPLQEHPVLRTDVGLLVLDIGYLWSRVTSGLYWLAHDHEKRRSDGERQRFTQAFAEAIELMAESQLREMAPPVIGGGSTTFYTEEDLSQAYGAQRVCDAAIDFGGDMMLVEVVSGQLSVPTRIGGDIEQFKRDTNRLVIGKCEQLNAVSTAVLHDASAVTGYGVPSLRIIPVLIVGGGYPLNPFTMTFIRERLAEMNFLVDARVGDICIIDIGELELLEGLSYLGHSPVDVLRRWKSSGIANVSMRNFILRTFGGGREVRPPRMDESVKGTFDKIREVLQLNGDTTDSNWSSD